MDGINEHGQIVFQINFLKTLKKRIILIGVILVILIPLFVILLIDLRQKNNADAISEKEVAPFLQDGDVICRLGDRIWSLAFKEFSPVDKRFSHLGIILIKDDEIMVINAQGSRTGDTNTVTIEPLKDFLQYAQQAGIYRMKNPNYASQLSQHAFQYIGRPFDWDFNTDDDSELYCSELLSVSLKDISSEIPIPTVWIKELSRSIVPVDICVQSDYFSEVAYFAD
jgi:hypothetical protein